VDLVHHTPGQAQTATQVSSIDPWHRGNRFDCDPHSNGVRSFFTSGYTNHLPAMIPVAMVYDTPGRQHGGARVSQKTRLPHFVCGDGREPDGQFMLPEDYAALYLQWATALNRVTRN